MKAGDLVLGFIGAGMVGGAHIRAFSQFNPIEVYDRDMDQGSLEDVCLESDVIFVAIPTPMRQDGECDTRALREVCLDVNEQVDPQHRVELVISSTCPPAFFSALAADMENVQLLFMPEFLTERTADVDFMNSPRFIIGARTNPEAAASKLRGVLENRFPRTRQAHMTWEEAALVKYGTNVFFATKISFFNELYRVARETSHIRVDPNAVIEEVINDGRIGRSHYKVPGHDGDFGFGGHCFPKDLNAYITFAEYVGVEAELAMAVWEVNEGVRKNRDWEEQKGRAVSDD